MAAIAADSDSATSLMNPRLPGAVRAAQGLWSRDRYSEVPAPGSARPAPGRTGKRLWMHAGLRTDLYELNMAVSYLRRGLTGLATFSLFIRRLPPHRGFLVAAGLEDCLAFLEQFAFTAADIAWLTESQRFSEPDLEALRRLRFTGDVWAVPEGAAVFARGAASGGHRADRRSAAGQAGAAEPHHVPDRRARLRSVRRLSLTYYELDARTAAPRISVRDPTRSRSFVGSDADLLACAVEDVIYRLDTDGAIPAEVEVSRAADGGIYLMLRVVTPLRRRLLAARPRRPVCPG